ncbi:hypothetical protein CERZMDRAFT_120505 [Cercospora zeae-maydis SCOH1-5]|uniref:WSC domain-containing protein n=1 Tax=Cercospora zeae-maydis SCOH1-5 TaxID=717836 RepID=A0A6A6FNW8_9PEZI|nr:hypothetical protein CERZMDRAFT_120505 [Cercospora zeae-maydis SCOH1-5]
MHRPTILLLFTSFIYTATAYVQYHCGDDLTLTNWDNCGEIDTRLCSAHCFDKCPGYDHAYAANAILGTHVCDCYCGS